MHLEVKELLERARRETRAERLAPASKFVGWAAFAGLFWAACEGEISFLVPIGGGLLWTVLWHVFFRRFALGDGSERAFEDCLMRLSKAAGWAVSLSLLAMAYYKHLPAGYPVGVAGIWVALWYRAYWRRAGLDAEGVITVLAVSLIVMSVVAFGV